MASVVFAFFFLFLHLLLCRYLFVVVVVSSLSFGFCVENRAQVCEACGTEFGLALIEDPSLMRLWIYVLDALVWSRYD